MRKNRTKHEAGKHRAAKRALALCFALIFVCSCLLPAFANSGVEFEAEPAAQEETAEEPETLDEDFAVEEEPVEEPEAEETTEDPVEEPAADEPTTQEEDGNEPATMDTGIVIGDDDFSVDESESTGMIETTDKDGNIVYINPNVTESDEVLTPSDDASDSVIISRPESGQELDKVDAGFAIPTNIYHFWLKEMNSYDLDDVKSAAKSADLSVEQYLALHGESAGCFHVMTAADGANLSDYKFTNPTSNDDPEGNSRTFAGWYTIDEFGEKHDFSFDQTLFISTGTTVEVFAAWKDAEDDVIGGDSTEESASAVASELKASVLIGNGDNLNVKVKGMPKEATKLSVEELSEDAFDRVYSEYLDTVSGEKKVLTGLVGFEITPKDDLYAKVQPDFEATVLISGLNDWFTGEETVKIIHKTSSGEIEILDADYSDGALAFQTTGFSEFIVATESEIATMDLKDLNVSIVDTVKKDGRLVLNIKNNLTGEEVTAAQLLADGFDINWYHNGAQMEREIVGYGASDIYNMAADKSWVNAAADDGADVTYKVVISKGTDSIDATEKVANYNTELKNGSFESPTVVNSDSSEEGFWGMNKVQTAEPWHQTDNTFEVANTTYTFRSGRNSYKKTLRAYGCDTAADGVQFAELNGDGFGTLYQDVLVTPGTTMYWQFYHRMRKYSGVGEYTWSSRTEWCKPIPKDKGDTMAMIIGPLEWAENITTQAQIDGVTSGRTTSGWYSINENGTEYKVYIYYHNTKNQDAWDRVSGQIQVPDNWGAVRFFFGATETGMGNTSVGNLLDAVHFSTTPNPVPAGEGQILVTKNIYGLTLDEVREKLSGSDKDFIDYNGSLSGSISFNASDWTVRTDEDGNQYVTATKTVDILNIGANQQITLNFAENDKAKVEGYDWSSEWVDEKQSATIGRSDDQNTGSVAVINTYTKNASEVVVSKKVKGLFGERDKVFDFKVAVNGKEYSFDLSNGENSKGDNVTIEAKENDTLTITETNAGGYTTKAVILDASGNPMTGSNMVIEAPEDSDSDTKTMQITITKEMMTDSGIHIQVINQRDGAPDNGILLDTLPYLIILGIAIGGAALLIIRRGKHDDE